MQDIKKKNPITTRVFFKFVTQHLKNLNFIYMHWCCCAKIVSEKTDYTRNHGIHKYFRASLDYPSSLFTR